MGEESSSGLGGPIADNTPLKSRFPKVFHDPIHGSISLHPLLVKIIDTPQFQRLRSIRQLGSTYFVYPGASHNRFEHSIGTCHLAGKLVRVLQSQPDLRVTEEDVLCVEMAGLCHDLGHGPFSHMFDNFLKQLKPDCKWTHEKMSCKMFEFLLDENDLWPELKANNLNRTDVKFVKEMIAGPLKKDGTDGWPYEGRTAEKSFLYEIVSNERNKVDVDKWDYFARDCHHLGISNSFDHNRFMQFLKVMKVEGKHLQICARDKECFNLYEMFHTRSVLHRRAYQHSVSKAIDVMITDALVLADPFLLIKGEEDEKLKMSESVRDVVAFANLTDDVFNRILHSTKPKLKPSKDILKRILKRNIYQSVGVIDDFKKKGIQKDSLPTKLARLDGDKALKQEDLAVSVKSLNYGMGQDNPVDEFRFFSKQNRNDAQPIDRKDVSKMLPDVFEESELEIFCKDDEKVDIARKCFESWMEKKRAMEHEEP